MIVEDFSPKSDSGDCGKSEFFKNGLKNSEFENIKLEDNEQSSDETMEIEHSRHNKGAETTQAKIQCPKPLNNEDVERKHYTEREITYNLLLRRLIDEFLDRTITYSHQPKNILTILMDILERNFPEFGNMFHRERICAYLKACRRNARKKNGEPFVRISARYLSAGQATRLADQIYEKEQKSIARMAALNAGNCQYHSVSLAGGLGDSSTTRHHVNTIPTPFNTAGIMIQPTGNLSLVPNQPQQAITPLRPGTAERLIASLLKQTAEFLLSVADRLDSGQSILPFPGASI